MTAGFEDRAADWIRSARTEGHDASRRYRDAFFDLLTAAGGRRRSRSRLLPLSAAVGRRSRA